MCGGAGLGPLGAAAVDLLPHMPADLPGLLDLGILGVEGDAHRQRVPKVGIQTQQHAVGEVDPQDHRHVHAGDLSADRVLTLPALLRPVAELAADLVARPVSDRVSGDPERVDKHPDPFIRVQLHAQVDRGTSRVADVEDATTGGLDRAAAAPRVRRRTS